MVLATKKTRHTASTSERRIVEEKQKRTTAAQSSSGSNRATRTEVRSKPSDGPKKPAVALTGLHARTIPTSLLGSKGGGMRTIGNRPWTQSERSATSDKKRWSKGRPSNSSQPTNSPTPSTGETRCDWIHGFHQLLLRRIGGDHPHGGSSSNCVEYWARICDCFKVFAYRQ